MIACGPKSKSTGCARSHAVIMGLMCLLICAKLNTTVLCIINGGSHNYDAWVQCIRYFPSGRKAVEPKHRAIYQL